MGKALLGYTTTVEAAKTIGEIQTLLVRSGASRILSEYGSGGRAEAVSFTIKTQFGERFFRLPANIDAVHKTLVRQWQRGRSGLSRIHTTPEHAARVAWRIILYWLQAQLAILETGMVTIDQVLLPYLQIDGQGRTLYEALVESQLALPGPRGHVP